VRKLSRRATIFMVATGVLLTASLAMAAVLAVGEATFHAETAEATDKPEPLDVAVTTDDKVVLDREAPGELIKLVFGNPNDFDVTLGVVPEGGGEPTGAVTFEVAAPEGVDCDADDLLVTNLNDWNGEVLEPGESHTDFFRLDLKPDANEDCDGTSLEITVKVTGEAPDPGEDEDEGLITGSSKV
jgi:hypothetical protein